MPNDHARETDLVLDPFQYAYILDTTKGNISVLVGPNKTSLSTTDQPVRFSAGTRRFEKGGLDEAIQQFPSAAEGWYMVLENPVPGEGKSHPASGPANQTPDLDFGRKVNIPGPLMFPLWPGQIASVIEGHNLRSNQYLVVRIYDEAAAKENWSKAIVKRQVQPVTPKTDGGDEQPPTESTSVLPETEMPDLTIGQLLVVKGTDVSFYMPPTGVEVLPDTEGEFVRNAVTLERLEYCILLDESGTKRYVRGPDVVFPEPTEAFMTSDGGKMYASDSRRSEKKPKGTRKYRAIELNESSGLYIKVIAPYNEGGKDFREGDEQFITGADQPIYFPREEHSIIKYGDELVHFAVAIPEGEARYVLDRKTGKIDLVKGPEMFLPDPRTQVVVRRILSESMVRLLFPGNEEAVQYNQELEELTGSLSYVRDRGGRRGRRRAGRVATRGVGSDVSHLVASQTFETANLVDEESAEAQLADDFERRSSYTPPRTITLETKYDGAVAINVWTGYAILTVDKRGGRRVHIGPTNVLLAYDETLEVLELSTGVPKVSDDPKRTVYLRVSNNTVSDLVRAETKDLVDVSVGVSYRVNFEGDEHEKWFAVENYVKFLTDHLRSLIRGAIKKVGVEEFNDSATDIIRDTILGQAGPEKNRPGRAFAENNMRVYDVEVLNVEIGNQTISSLLTATQHATVKSALQIRQREQELEVTKRTATIDQETEEARYQTAVRINELATAAVASKLAKEMAEIEAESTARQTRLEQDMDDQELHDKLLASGLARVKKKEDQRLVIETADTDRRLGVMRAETDSLVLKAEAIGPSFIEALNLLGDKEFAAKVAKEIGPLAVLRGNSISDTLSDLVQNLPKVGESIQKLIAANGGTSGDGDA